MLRFVAIVTILVPLAAILVGIIEDVRYVSAPKPKYLGSIRYRQPSKTNEFGRYTKPLSAIDYSWVSSSKIFEFFALKHWDFKLVSTSKYFIVAAIANFNYIAYAFVYVIDRTNRAKEFYQYSSRSLLAQAVKEQARSSIDGCTIFNKSATEYISLCYNKKQRTYEMNVNVPMNGNHQILFDIKIKYSDVKDQSMVLIYPIEEIRPAYTHKIATLPARGQIRFDDADAQTLDGFCSSDWTLAYSERSSRWKWVSLSVMGTNTSNEKPVKIGINLSDIVYNDQNGMSMENAIWIDGKVHFVDRVVYELPEEQYIGSRPWHIYSIKDSKSESVNFRLTFQPWGSQEVHVNVLLLAGDFVQVFGAYDGNIEVQNQVYTIENGFGVAENHYAKW